MMRKILLIAFILLFSRQAFAQTKDSTMVQARDTFSNAFLDTVQVKKRFSINDYTLIGVQYGVGLSQTMFNPTMKQSMLLNNGYYGVTFTRYGKLFGYMPYFGLQIGLMYGHQGYKFKKDKETGTTGTVENASQAVIDVIEMPMMAHCHVDFWKMKIIANIGIYGGYRLNIERTGESVDEKIRNDFLDTDNRIDYGIKGGVGFGFVLDPFEIHFEGMVNYSLSSLYEPDYYSKYYYRFAYPMDIIISCGIHYQLTRRAGKTNHQMRRQAYDEVYEKPKKK